VTRLRSSVVDLRRAWVVLALLVVGCASTGSPTATEPVPSAPLPTAPVASSSPSGSTESPLPDPPMAEPPSASLAVDGGDPAVGQLGTFTWENGGSDSPWLDGSPLHVGAGEQLFMALADPVALDAWTVRRVTPGNRDGIGAVEMADQRGGIVTFPAPPIGTWSVQVRVRFAGDLGTALYYWLIAVD
jgi:hypothetical protein